MNQFYLTLATKTYLAGKQTECWVKKCLFAPRTSHSLVLLTFFVGAGTFHPLR